MKILKLIIVIATLAIPIKNQEINSETTATEVTTPNTVTEVTTPNTVTEVTTATQETSATRATTAETRRNSCENLFFKNKIYSLFIISNFLAVKLFI